MARLGGFTVTVWLAAASAVVALPPSADELIDAARWAEATFAGAGEAQAPDVGLTVRANYGSVEKNARGMRPLLFGSAKHYRGFYCHAPSAIAVRLARAGKSFEALVGVDSNDQTRPGRGSIEFVVRTGTRELFRSPVMREGASPCALSCELGGATEFTLEVTDGGDGISCDQADWAEARVVFQDGSAAWLSDLPMAQPQRAGLGTGLPFAFTYGGRHSDTFLGSWKLVRGARDLPDDRVERTLELTDPETGLVVVATAVRDLRFPMVEWTLRFRNTGKADTPILEHIEAMRLVFDRGVENEFVLRHHRGDFCAPPSFEPLVTTLAPGTEQRFAPEGGRPSNGRWPYFNLAWGNHGVILAVGWPGQWAAAFVRDGGTGLRIIAGQELAHFVLRPGEEVRAPLGLVQFWDGDWLRGQNVWRQWMLQRTFPKPDGKPLAPALAGCSGWCFPGLMCNQAGEIEFIRRYLEEDLRLDWWWMDAGWYPCDGVGWPKVGTWEVDRKRYPDGLRGVTSFAHARGIRCIVWFEPERVHAGSWLAEQRPAWVRGGAGGGLFDMGNAEARAWITDRVDAILRDEDIDLYRQDFNIDPLGYWRGNDAPDRQGITEIRHVEGYLAYWDELRRRHPGMLIDSCASGGRRNDLETMRRAVPLLRTDCEFNATANQCHTYGFDLWLPYHSLGNCDLDPYNFRSNMSPMMGFVWDVRRKDLDYDLARRLVGQWREVAPSYLGDFYPLTRYSVESDVWMAWQFDRPDLGTGMIQAFRREDCIFDSAQLPLRGLVPEARYELRNLDAPGTTVEATGRELMDRGARVVIPDRPGAAIVAYKVK